MHVLSIENLSNVFDYCVSTIGRLSKQIFVELITKIINNHNYMGASKPKWVNSTVDIIGLT